LNRITPVDRALSWCVEADFASLGLRNPLYFCCIFSGSRASVRRVTGPAAAFRDIHQSLLLRPPALEIKGVGSSYEMLASVRARILNQNQTDSGARNRFGL